MITKYLILLNFCKLLPFRVGIVLWRLHIYALGKALCKEFHPTTCIVYIFLIYIKILFVDFTKAVKNNL